MKFNIPKGGKTLSLAKKLVTLDEGEFETTDKELVELLKKAKGVTEVKAKAKAKE